jgi:hypothetical protein
MTLVYRYTALPDRWPGKPGVKPKHSLFKIQWTKVERMLEREIRHLGGRDVELAVDIRRMGDFRADGMLRADARPVTPAVIISFKNRDNVRLQFPCARFTFWQDNVWAIARALEALRKVDRYGVTQGDAQYAGFKAIGAGSAPVLQKVMTAGDAAEVLAKYCPFPARVIYDEASVATVAIQTAKARTHPDAGGTAEEFQRVSEAAVVLTAFFEADAERAKIDA